MWGKRADRSLGAFVLGCSAVLFLPLPSPRLFLQEVLLTSFPKHFLPFAFLSLDRCSLSGYRAVMCFTISPAASSQSWLLLAEGSGFEHAAPCLSILLPQPHYGIVDTPSKGHLSRLLPFFINVCEGKSSLIIMKTIAEFLLEKAHPDCVGGLISETH